MVDEVISDRGPQFAGKFNQHLAERLGITWKLSTAYHPQTDGQTERTNRTIEDMLRHFVSPSADDWDKYLAEIQFAINNAWQESVRQTPFLPQLWLPSQNTSGCHSSEGEGVSK